ncbi:MAG: hypothetical protein HUK14_04155 [Muribaculaceae bacterium]|nr:hypothetical protein [Muribaculaceae bacterium]
MKKLFFLAIVAMIAVFANAQDPSGLRAARKSHIERVMSLAEIAEAAEAMSPEEKAFAASMAAANDPAKAAEQPARSFARDVKSMAPYIVKDLNNKQANGLKRAESDYDKVTPPEGLVTEEWFIRDSKMYNYVTSREKRYLTVGFDGNDVYFKGLFNEFPDSWVKGTIKDGIATIPMLQYLGVHSGYDCWTMGFVYDYEAPIIGDCLMNYDAATKTFTSINDLIASAQQDYPSIIVWLREVKIESKNPFAEPAEMPYFNSLATEELMDEMTVIDANNDGCSWEFLQNEGARYIYSTAHAGDDWLITRAFELKKDMIYRFDFEMRASGYTERIEVKMGSKPTAEGMTTMVREPYVFENTDYKLVTNDRIMVPEDGIYYFGIHALSDADKYAIYVRNVVVDKGVSVDSPTAVVNLKLTPKADASNTATLTFDAPTETMIGKPLPEGADITVEIYRDNVKVKELACKVGDKDITYTEDVPSAATYTYKLIPVMGELKGDNAVVAAWIGLDYPAEVTGIEFFDNTKGIEATWSPVTSVGANGGIVFPENTTYNFCNVETYEFWGTQVQLVGKPLNAEPIIGTKYFYETNMDEGSQRLVYYAIQAENATGHNTGVMVPILMGAPYKLIMHEPFDGATVYYWNYTSPSYFSGVSISNNPSDGDAGNLEFYSVAEQREVVRFESGKIALGGATKATICFDAMKDGNCQEYFKVLVLRAGEREPVEVATIDLTTEYKQYKVSLADFKDEPWIRIFFDADFEGEGIISLDNVTVSDLMQYNASIVVSAPTFITAGQKATVKATVSNDGEQPAAGYTVRFFANDELFCEYPADKTVALPTGRKAEYTADYQTSIFNEAADVTFRATVELEGELKPEDNSAEACLSLVSPNSSPVASVSAGPSGQDVVISWVKPQGGVSEVVEDFEMYPSNAIYRDGEFCYDWQGVDVSQGETFGWGDMNIKWPYTWSAFAFGIVDTEACELDTRAGLSALSGVKAMGFFSEVNAETQDDQQSDKYAISPELSGQAQTIYFGARIFSNVYGPETFEILASSTDRKVKNFTKVAEFSQTELGWKSFSVDLPEGTKYFAIHYTTNCAFGMFFDDIIYTVNGSDPTGYNIYVDQNFVAKVGGEASSYTYNPAQLAALAKAPAMEKHTASVTALYGGRESRPVSVDFEMAGIDDIHADADAAAEYFTVSGIQVPADKLLPGLYLRRSSSGTAKVVVK